MHAQTGTSPSPYHDGRLHARPGQPVLPALSGGAFTLTSPDRREALFHAPPDSRRALPLLLLLHGAGGLDGGSEELALALAERHGACLLAPRALGSSWDVLRGGYGPDLAFLDLALCWTMQHYLIDPCALSIAGFSDGASYALSVGLMNGDLFGDILAFSPGFARPIRRVGQPRVFIAHGLHDPVLPVVRGQTIAKHLSDEGYQVQYEEFDGVHRVPAEVADGALDRVLKPAR